ncbi:MAG TPA: hypothetical protein VFG37_13365 [Planctomycetota bacterium]|nr:hypothetical protein [Planctomycetota bacterium]
MEATERVLARLTDAGLLLQQDAVVPSVVGLVTGESLKTSWWGHPKGRLVFGVLSELADHRDVLFTKLLAGKSTLVHRRLWPSLLGVATAREAWQTRRLSPAARRVLRRIDGGAAPLGVPGPVARELEARLLAVAREVHTESGRHALELEAWNAWSRRARCRRAPSLAAARRALEQAVLELGAPLDALPWQAGGPSP